MGVPPMPGVPRPVNTGDFETRPASGGVPGVPAGAESKVRGPKWQLAAMVRDVTIIIWRQAGGLSYGTAARGAGCAGAYRRAGIGQFSDKCFPKHPCTTPCAKSPGAAKRQKGHPGSVTEYVVCAGGGWKGDTLTRPCLPRDSVASRVDRGIASGNWYWCVG
jgi:hypothetical protein